MILDRLRGPRSIFAHSFFLVMGVVIAVSLGSISFVVLRPPPNAPPVSAYEVARLLDGKPVLSRAEFRSYRADTPPVVDGGSRDNLIELAVRTNLVNRDTPVHFVRPPPSNSFMTRVSRWLTRTQSASRRLQQNMRRELELYGPEGRFNPRVFGSFTIAAQQPDGRWNVVVRDDGDSLERWQSGTVRLILISVLIAFFFAWLFSRRLAKPIRAFAQAADRIGRNQLVDPVKLQGPSEIRLAAQALNEMQARLQRYVSERTSVVGAIAHDLRTPLSRLNFHLESAPDELKSKAAAEIAEMEAMIATTLDFVQNEGRRQPSEPIDLGLLVEGVVDDLTDLGHNASLLSSADAVVRGDPVLLKRLFANLILNAVSYGTKAQVSIRTEDHSAIVDIEDNGPGLSEADMARAFEPFYRAEGSRNRSTGGIGLGLAIVQTAAHAHGGSVTLRNLDGGGLCARVTLPIGE